MFEDTISFLKQVCVHSTFFILIGLFLDVEGKDSTIFLILFYCWLFITVIYNLTVCYNKIGAHGYPWEIMYRQMYDLNNMTKPGTMPPRILEDDRW